MNFESYMLDDGVTENVLASIPEVLSFPCLRPKLVLASRVTANDYNPNRVARPEMELLQHSIEEDGVTQPVVVILEPETGMYIVIDGFHRYTIISKDLKSPVIPVVVLEKDILNRMASTIRHNRARGKHAVDLMSSIVAQLIKLGWSDIEIADHLGMEAEEVLRLKQMTGLAGLFAGQPYSKSWERYEPEE